MLGCTCGIGPLGRSAMLAAVAEDQASRADRTVVNKVISLHCNSYGS